MRYYKIEFLTPGTTTVAGTITSHPAVSTSLSGGVSTQQLSGLLGGGLAALSGSSIQPDPGALNITLDAYVFNYDTPTGLPVIQIFGVPRALLSQAQNLTGYGIKVYGGFQKGLPLNNPAQAGELFAGKVYQSFGNWQGTNMCLNLVVSLDGSVRSDDANISFQWKAGTPLSQAIATTLTNAFPGVPQTIQISPKLVLAHDETHVDPSLVGFSQTLKGITQPILGGSYAGVSVARTQAGFLVQDGTVPPTPLAIQFQDLIGQPTWIGSQTIQFVCPMRNDIGIGAIVTLPQGITNGPGGVTTTAASQPQAKNQLTFSGKFSVSQVHHLGDFRAPDGAAWITVINAFDTGTS